MMDEWFCFLTTDQVIAYIEHTLKERGVTFNDIEKSIASELGVPFEQWWAYGEVKRAAYRYQASLWERSQKAVSER